MKKKLHYAWIICLAGVLMNFCSIGLVANIFGIYQPFIIQLNGFTNTQGSLLVTIRTLSGILSLFVIDKFYQKLNIKLGAFLSIVSVSLAYFAYGFADTYFGYVVAAFLSGIGYSLGGMIPCSIIIDRWFDSHKALALGICSAGTGLATIIMPGIITFFIENYGLKTAFIYEAIMIMVMAVVLYLLFVNDPKEKNTTALLDAHEKKKENEILKEKKGMTGSQKMIMIFIMFLLGSFGNTGYTHTAVLFSTEGYSSAQIAWIISISGIVLTIGKCVYGEINDRLGTYRSNFLFGTLFVIGMGCSALCFLHCMPIVWIAIFTMGMGFPMINVGMPLWAKDLTKGNNYEKNLKQFQIACTTGAMVFSFTPGLTADYFHSYVPIYTVFTIGILTFVILLQYIYKKSGASKN